MSGKTSLLLNDLADRLNNGQKVLFVSLEESAGTVAHKLVHKCKNFKINSLLIGSLSFCSSKKFLAKSFDVLDSFDAIYLDCNLKSTDSLKEMVLGKVSNRVSVYISEMLRKEC